MYDLQKYNNVRNPQISLNSVLLSSDFEVLAKVVRMDTLKVEQISILIIPDRSDHRTKQQETQIRSVLRNKILF